MSGFWLHRFVCSVCGYRCRTWERMGAHRQACGSLIRRAVCQELAAALKEKARKPGEGFPDHSLLDVAEFVESYGGASPGGE